MESHGDVGDHAKRAFGSDEQPCEVVSRSRLPRSRAGVNDASVSEDRGNRQDVLAHRPVPDGRRARRPCGRHAANRGVSARIDREHEAGVAESFVQLQASDARFNRRVEIFDTDSRDSIQIANVDGDTAAQRLNVTFERRACTEWNDRQTVARRDADNLDHFIERLWKTHDVGSRRRVIRLAVTVMVSDRRRIAGPRAQSLFQLRNGVVDRLGIRVFRHVPSRSARIYI